MWGVYVTTPAVAKDSAKLEISVTTRNDADQEAAGKFRIMMGTESVAMDAFENWQQVVTDAAIPNSGQNQAGCLKE